MVVYFTNFQAFSKFVKAKEKCDSNGDRSWKCCSNVFKDTRDFHKHASQIHCKEIDQSAADIIQNGSEDAKWKALSVSRDKAVSDRGIV